MPTSNKCPSNSSEAAAESAGPVTPAESRSRRLEVVHRTHYYYGAPAYKSGNDLRMEPRQTPWQDLDFFLLTVRPPTRLNSFRDLHRNTVHHFDIAENHTELFIESRSRVTTRSKYNLEALPYGVSHEDLRGYRHVERCYEYLQPSHYVSLDPEIWRAALDARDLSDDVFQTSYSIMEYIYDEFRYDAEATQVSTSAMEAFSHRHGVCQDFAHVGIAMCRTLGIPARYVSGYLFDPHHDTYRGTQASHAWFEIFIKGHDVWYGLDPTNNKVVDENYVALANGRDYLDVAPVEGTFYGGGPHRRLEVSVKITELG